MLKQLFTKLIVAVLMIIIILIGLAMRQSQDFRRDPLVLMDKYYRYKYTRPVAAEEALRLILKQNPHDLSAMTEWSQWLLERQDYQQAIPLLERIHQQLPGNDEYTYQLGYAYYEEGRWQDAIKLLKDASVFSDNLWKEKASQTLYAMASFVPFYQDHALITSKNRNSDMNIPVFALKADVLPVLSQQTSSAVSKSMINPLDRFYQLKKHSPKHALRYLQRFIKQHPHHAIALKEAGFLAIKEKQTSLALYYLTQAYQLSHEPAVAMQIAYLYNQQQQNKLAYQYFQWAAYGNDVAVQKHAENALTNLVGQQTKTLPKPYYGEFFAMPFTQSRFGLTVTQFIGRLGVEQTNRWQTKEYVFSQRTQDNQSSSYVPGKLSQIYEDDVQITGIGVQASPIPHVPILLYGEMGAAYDLIYRNRDRWRSDFRGGFMYYQEQGHKPAYYSTPVIRADYYATWYADCTYFSRYNNNVIGLAKTHQGIRAFQYKSSLVNLYVRGLVVQDVQRLFYNNFAEIGPGIGFIPSNRYNVEIRFDYINGVYLPAGSSVNPYSKYYTNKLLQLFVYVKI